MFPPPTWLALFCTLYSLCSISPSSP